MADVKFTQRDYFNAAIKAFGGKVDGEVQEFSNEDMVAFFEGRIAQLDKKKSGGSKASEAQVAIRTAIKEVLANADGGMTATAILNKIKATDPTTYEDLSVQRVTANLKFLRETEGTVVSAKDKKSTIFSLA